MSTTASEHRWTSTWNEARTDEYFIAAAIELPFKPEIAYAVERYVWRHYRGVFIQHLDFQRLTASLALKGPQNKVGVGVLFTDEHILTPAEQAKFLVENAINVMKYYYFADPSYYEHLPPTL